MTCQTPRGNLVASYYLHLLYLILIILAAHKNRHYENFSTGIERTNGIFHICPAGFVKYLEITRGI